MTYAPDFTLSSQSRPMAMRDNFPPPGADYMGGECDGYCYRTTFSGSTPEQTYDMVRQFLEEEGYDDLPLPADAAELARFRLPTRNRQILMFEDNGYVHNPIKILFPTQPRRRPMLILEVYNESLEGHLLRFHGIT